MESERLGDDDMKRYDLIIVGAGPWRFFSSELRQQREGLKVIVFDENEKPGGQLV